MNELEPKKSAAMKMMDVEYLPSIQQIEHAVTNYKKYPLAKISSLGVAFTPLVSAVQSVAGAGVGGSGLYYVNTAGKQMFQSSGGFIGSLKSAAGTVGGGQARMIAMPLDPTMLFMSAALMTIERKLDDIKELQQEIIDYLKAKEKARIVGNINVLSEVLNNYKYNWDNDKYKTNKHILVQDIRKDAEQSLLLCRNQIEHQLTKKGLFHSDKEVNTKISKLQGDFGDYQQALFLYSFSAFLEVMLLENFDSQYLKSITDRIEEYACFYQQLYTSCYNQLEGFSQGSVQSILIKKLAGISKGAGGLIGKIPVVSKGSVDEALVSTGEKLENVNTKKTQKTLKILAESASKCSSLFVENIEEVNRIYNQPHEILFDIENIYFVDEKT